MTGVASWLNSAFYNFDYSILAVYNNLAKGAGNFLTPFMQVVSAFSYKGLALIGLGLILLLFAKTRKIGAGMLVALLINFALTNLLLKNVIARPRPYTFEVYREWWQLVGAGVESDFSFPSGHTAIMASGMFAIFLISKKKKYTWLCLIPIVLMGISRNYLMVHYPTDVIGGVVSGCFAAVIAFVITHYSYKAIERNAGNAFCNFVLNADVKNLFGKK